MAKTAQELLGMMEELDVYAFATVDDEGAYAIDEGHCLHCGSCFERCPAEAIMRLG